MTDQKKEPGIPYARVERALTFLATTDDEFALLCSDVLRTKSAIEAQKSAIILHTDGTGPVKQATANCHPDVREKEEEYFHAVYKRDSMKNERERNETIINVWRSVSSAKNHGQII